MEKKPPRYRLICLLCGHEGEDNLVQMQEHAMAHHGYTREDIRHVKHQLMDYGHLYTFPDGKDWLEARHKALR